VCERERESECVCVRERDRECVRVFCFVWFCVEIFFCLVFGLERKRMGLLSNPEAIASSAGASCLRKEAVAAAAGAASTTWKEEGGRFAHLYLTRERITIATTAICIPHRTRALLYRPFSFVRTPYFVAEETGDGRGIICNQFPNRRRSRRISTRLFLPRSFAEDSNAALSANVPEVVVVVVAVCL